MSADRRRALGITTQKRVASLPDMPTVLESGVPGFQVSSWYGLLGPAGIPLELARKINAEVRRIPEMPDVPERLQKDGAEPISVTPEEFAAAIREDIQMWMHVVKMTGAKAD